MITYHFSLYDFEYFLAILVRTASFVAVMPLYSLQGVPTRLRIGLAFFISVVLYQYLPHAHLEYVDVIGYAVIVVKEAIAGILMGFFTNVCTYIIALGGQFIDQHLGLMMAQEFNPMTNTTTAITGNFYNYVIFLLLFVSGLDHYLIRAFTESYQLIPVGGTIFHTDQLLTSFIQFMTDMFVLGFRIALPIFACIMILNSVLGIMAKVAPQMNMFSVGMQLKVMAGFLLLVITVQILPYISDYINTEIHRMMVFAVEGMS